MDLLTRDDRRQFWFFMLVALVVLAAGMGLRDPWPPDEPRFTLIARHMVESGNWLFPHRGMELYSDKPPMLMWLEAGAFELLRSWRIAFLLPSLLAGLGTLALTYDLGRRLWNPRVALFAAIALLSSLQFVEQVKRAQIDPLVMFWITLGNWGLIVHFLRGPNWRAYWLGCFAAGLGVITKGVGVLALLMVLPYLFARRQRWEGVTVTEGAGWRWAGGALAFFLAIAVWLAPMLIGAYASGEPRYMAYVHDILFRQTAERYANSWQHEEPFWFFGEVLIRDWFPLCLLYIAAVPRWWKAFRERDARVFLPVVWLLLILVFFSIPRGKREVYLMPGLPMMALAVAAYLPEWIRTRWLRTLCLALAAIAGVVLFGGGLWALFGHPRFAARLADRELVDGGRMFWTALTLMGACFLAAIAWMRLRRGPAALLIGMGAAWVCWSLLVYPQFNDSESASGLMRKVDQRVGADGEVGLVAWREEHLLQTHRPVTEFGFAQSWPLQIQRALAWQAGAPEHRWIFLNGEALWSCVDRAKAVNLGTVNRYQWWMFRAEALIPGCKPPDQGAPTAPPPEA
jgi:4-amino-4-deoxy-L-arabinose transferase-like glycosyltransferase